MELWLFSKFSLSVLKEVAREEYGEYVYWYTGVKGQHIYMLLLFPSSNIVI